MYRLFAINQKTKHRRYVGSFSAIRNASLYLLGQVGQSYDENIIFVLRDPTETEEWYWDEDCWVDYEPTI